jgi:hypothetical protein
MASFWVCAIVTTISALVSLGFSVAAVVASDRSVRTSSHYALARSFALAVTDVVMLIGQLDGWLTAMALTMVIVQSADAVVGRSTGDRLKTVGPAATAVINLAALVWFLG